MDGKRLVRCCGVIAASLLLVACNQVPDSQPLVEDSQWQQGQLDNGLKYHLRSVSGAPVSFRLLVHAGAVDEAAEQAGYAHFLEHMAFLGSDGFDAGKVESLFVGAGVTFGDDLNAFTSHDVTSYQIDLPDNKRMEDAIVWLSDIATGKLTLDPALLENEKGAVLGEFRLRQRGDKPAELKAFEALLQGSRYDGIDVLGTQDSVKNINREGLLAFYQAHYRPQNTELIITGNIDNQRLEPMIARYFNTANFVGGRAGEDVDIDNAAIESGDEGIASLTPDPLYLTGAAGQQAGISLLIELGDSRVTTDLQYQTMLLEDAVLRAISRRLNDRHIETQSPLLGSYSFPTLVIDRYIGAIGADFAESDRLIAQQFFAEELASLRDHGVGTFEFESVKDSFLNEINGLDTQWLNKRAVDYSEDRLNALILGKTQQSKEDVRSQLQNFVDQLNQAKLNKAINSYLSESRNKPVFVVTREEGASKAKATFTQFTKQFSAKGKALIMASSAMDIPMPEKGGEITFYEELEPTTHRWTLENGIDVWLRQMPEAGDRAYVYLMSSGGMAALPSELRYASTLAPSVLARSGLAGISASKLEQLLVRHNTYVESVLWETSHGLYSETAKQELPFALSVLYQAMTAAKVDEQYFSAVQQESVVEQGNWLSSPLGSYVSQVVGTLYPADSTLQLPTGEDIQQVSPDQVQSVVDTLMRKKRNFTLVVSADIEVSDFNRLLRRYVAGISFEAESGSSAIAPVITDYRTNPKVSTASKQVAEAVDNTLTYQVHLLSQGKPKSTKDRFTADILDRLLNKRYRDELRNAHGLGYDPSAQLIWSDGSGETLVIFTVNAAPGKLDAVRASTRQVLEKARAGFTAEEFAVAKSQLATALTPGLTNPQEQARMLSSYVLFGADPQAVLHPDKVLSTLTLEEINALSERVIGKEAQQMESMLMPKEPSSKAGNPDA
ncbi:insulinase family protein [Photobacterium alginatilyticum]|uniref:Insulinase family protein n=1 Tax=Photobacterium alginatilyticum TaxID=1775171 RepID=A0ABW9YFL3_9GAMM|nr:M16 family metallopeptidase [Photobacterium alginatilyticum]NBI52038.1 insulinase family protein [Photobacterium alginatilyticum]